MGETLLRHEIERAQRSSGKLALMFIDVDKLKETNDRLDHAAGDAVLRDVFGSLQARLRPYDPIVRWGGDEFVCAVSGASVEDALRRVQDAQMDLAKLYPKVTISTGMALEEGDHLMTVVERADRALLHSRRNR